MASQPHAGQAQDILNQFGGSILEITQALEFVLAGRAVLFTGSGFSVSATNLRGVPFKTGKQFADHLSALSGLSEGTPLEDAAEWFTTRCGKSRMIEELQQEFTAMQVADAQVELLRCPWKRIYTTNYDNVAEAAAVRAGKLIIPATLSDTIN